MEKKTEFNIWYWVLAFMAVIFIQNIIAGTRDIAQISYSQFETYLEEGRVQSVAVGKDHISGVFDAPVDGRNQGRPCQAGARRGFEWEEWGRRQRAQIMYWGGVKECKQCIGKELAKCKRVQRMRRERMDKN